MSYPIFIRGDELAFSRKLIMPNARASCIDPEALYTPFGFVIPLDYHGLGILDYLEHGDEALMGTDAALCAVIITSAGVARLHTVAASVGGNNWRAPKTKIGSPKEHTSIAHTVARLLLSPTTDWCRSIDMNAELVAASAMALCPRLEAAVDLVGKVRPLAMDAYHFTTIAHCVAELRRRNFTQCFPYVRGTKP